MKRKMVKLRLSPNEEARIIREELERRRKLRIQQVREQQRYISMQIRREVEQRRQQELDRLEKELRAEWEQQQREKLDTLQRLYQESLQLVGQGHRSAKENEPNLAAISQKEEENHVKAEERYREALKELKSQKLKELERQTRSIRARKKALHAEKERSAKVASLPPPPPNPIQNIDSKKSHVVKKSDVSAFAATHYHMPESTVDREVGTEQPNAHDGAELEVRRLQDLQKEEKRRREEQLEKARLRGKQALRREHLVQDRERLLVELEHMQQRDLLRRRQQVSQMPPQIFQPLYKRQEMREDFQREMEFAFEDMYTGERKVKGDLVVQLIPEPLPALSTGSQDQELDVTMDETATPGTENSQLDTEQEDRHTEHETSAQVEISRPAPRRALRKLLDRIRSQRNQWTDRNSHVTAADLQSHITDEIPERDTTIDTGSLTSEEKDKMSLIELPEPAHSPLALETTEQSAAADTPLPDVLCNRIQEFEEEQKKREEQLEREKQQQVVLLQELEEQKAKLEQMLIEAQQEREHLKAAVTQEVPINHPQQHDTAVTPCEALELVPAPDVDQHTRRVREYQQRLLDQNRIHQRSVEVARQRLEEYQRALRIRYNMTATSFLPAVAPAGLIQLPLHGTQSIHHPTPLHLPTTPAVPVYNHAKPQTSVEGPASEADILVSPPHPPVSSLSICSKLLPHEVESASPRNQRPSGSAWLNDRLMERETEQMVRPSSLTTEPLPYQQFSTHHSTIVPLQSDSDPIQSIHLSVSDGASAIQDQTLLPGYWKTESLSCRKDNMERQRQELQNIQNRVLEQREVVALKQRQQEEESQRQEEQQLRHEEEMKQIRQQKETLKELIHNDAQPIPEAASEVLVSENIRKTRLKLLASLLRAIEQTNGGSLSHLEGPHDSTQQSPSNSGETVPSLPAQPDPTSVLLSELPSPPRATKPPVTRVRLGIIEMMTKQHELSAIQEVETPANTSQVTGLEGSLTDPSNIADWDPQEESHSSVATNRTQETPSWSSSGQQIAEKDPSSGMSSRRSSQLIWRERLLMGAGTSPESSESDSVHRIVSPLSSDSGRGADYSGPAITSCRSPTESAHRPPDSDCLSSTSISTGSYITTDPEQNLNTVDKSPPLRHCVGPGQGVYLLDVPSPSGQSSCIKDNLAASHPGLAVESLFNDSSIQRIIDRYTRELNISLSTTGKTTDREGSYVEEPISSVSRQSLVGISEKTVEDEGSPSCQSPPSDAAGAQRSGSEGDNPVNPHLEHFSGVDPSLTEDQEQDFFRPLIGHMNDQSSCLAADHRDSTMEQLVGQPSAHSSMIGQLPGSLVSMSLDQGGWESTLSQMIGRLSHQASSHWLSGGQDFYAGQLIGQIVSEETSTWVDEGPEERQMRPLVGELDESAGQHSGNSDERTHVDFAVSTETSVPSYPALPPEASSQSHSGPANVDSQPAQTLQLQTSPMSPQRAEVFPGSDSFHPLLAEVTHNETVERSMSFHLPEHDVPNSPEGQPASRECNVSTPSEEFESHHEHSAGSELSPECLRTEAQSTCMTASNASHESFSQLITSQYQPHKSVLTVGDTMKADVELTALSLSNLTVCDDPPTLDLPQPEGLDAYGHCHSERCRDSLGDPYSGKLNCENGSNQRNALPVSDKEAACEKGILEQSEITLVSLTDTTLQDQETTIDEEEGMWESNEHPDGVREEGAQGLETEVSESKSLLEETPEDENQTQPVMFLEFEWGPSRGLQEVYQQKRKALLQRSASRVAEVKARGTLSNTQHGSQAPSEARHLSKAQDAQPVTCKAKTKSGSQHRNTIKSKGGQADQHQSSQKSGFIRQKKPQLHPPGDSRLKKVDEVKMCTPEQRKREVSEMHQRTQRLYEQLEEVKQQKAVRSRHEAYALNRLKAKEFHKKTLQKLRAKQTLQ